MNKKLIPVFVLVVVIVGALCFFAGTKLSSKNKSFGPGQNGFSTDGQAMENGFAGANRGSGSSAFGTIIAKDEESLTIETQNGGSKTILLSGDTKVSKTIDGIFDDLEVGKTVTVSGKSNSDGSLTATSIDLRSLLTSMPGSESKTQ